MKTITTLNEITPRLYELIGEINGANEAYAQVLYNYELIKAWWYRQEENMALKNAEMREAHLSAYLEVEGILEKKLKASNDFYRLKTEKELLLAISSNLRVIEGTK